MEVLRSFSLWDQEIILWFTNHKPLVPTLYFVTSFYWTTTFVEMFQKDEENFREISKIIRQIPVLRKLVPDVWFFEETKKQKD